MNRHIWGFTLFAVIIKTTVLVYWAFFSPVNFYSVQEPVLVETKSSYKCTSFKYKKKTPPSLQSVVIDTVDGGLTANINLGDYERARDLSANKLQLHIYTEDMRPVKTIDVYPGERFIRNGILSYSLYSSDFVRLNRRVNYYAQVDVLASEKVRSENLVYEIRQATPVLLSNGKK